LRCDTPASDSIAEFHTHLSKGLFTANAARTDDGLAVLANPHHDVADPDRYDATL
jgi:hypothetical protein